MRIPCAPLLLGLLSLASCASGPKYAEVSARIPPLSAQMGRIYFYRSGSMFGAAVQSKILLNGEQVGSSIPGGFFFVDRPPGNFDVSCSTEVTRKVEFTLADQETRYVVTKIAFGIIAGRIYPELVAPAEGDKSVRGLSYTGTELPAAAKAAQASP